MTLTVAIDVDGPVAALHEAWFAEYSRIWDDDLIPEDVTNWDVHTFVRPECGEKVYDLLTPKLWDSVKDVKGALEAVSALQKDPRFKVIFVTSAVWGCEGRKLRWLVEHCFIDNLERRTFSEYIECSDKSKIKADILIDDGAHNFVGFDGYKILWNAPHNQGVEHPDIDVRVQTWDEAMKWVDDYAVAKTVFDSVAVHVTEQRCPEQCKGFREIIEKFYDVHRSKNADYSPANILGTGELGLATRLWDKCIRYLNLMGFDIRAELVSYTGPKDAKNESVEDTLMDMGVYAIIGLLLRRGQWGR